MAIQVSQPPLHWPTCLHNRLLDLNRSSTRSHTRLDIPQSQQSWPCRRTLSDNPMLNVFLNTTIEPGLVRSYILVPKLSRRFSKEISRRGRSSNIMNESCHLDRRKCSICKESHLPARMDEEEPAIPRITRYEARDPPEPRCDHRRESYWEGCVVGVSCTRNIPACSWRPATTGQLRPYPAT